MKAEEMLKRVQAIAAAKGGECVSPNYQARPAKMRFRCAEGHVWSALASNILYNDQWCAKCRLKPSEEWMEKFDKEIDRRGGKKLFKKLGKRSEPHTFECVKGHQFRVLPSHVVNRGVWCEKCSYVERGERQRVGIEAARDAAVAKGGLCLSTEYVNARKLGRWRCKKGHEWNARFSSILYEDQWCPDCWDDARKLGIEAAQKAAEENGGECLTEEYKSNKDMATWECAEGHVWESRFYNVVHQGTWCPICRSDRSYLTDQPRSEQRPLGIEDCKAAADRNRGLCLSGYYVNYEHPLAWRCERKHEFMSSLRQIEERINFCVECANIERRQEMLQAVNEWAGEYGGRCLETSWKDAMEKMSWRCEKGHEWRASMHNMEGRDEFCHVCAIEAKRKDYLDKARLHARELGGRCLADEWISAQTKIPWICEKKHRFEKSWNNVVAGPFCGTCAKERKFQKDGANRLRLIANENHGKWIESEYKGKGHRYEFECRKGHRFRATYDAARRSWKRNCGCL